MSESFKETEDWNNSTYALIAKTSRIMKNQLKRDNGKKHPQWFVELRQNISVCYDCASVLPVIKKFNSRYGN